MVRAPSGSAEHGRGRSPTPSPADTATASRRGAIHPPDPAVDVVALFLDRVEASAQAHVVGEAVQLYGNRRRT